MPERDTAEPGIRRRRARFRDGRPPLNLGAAPTIRLGEGYDLVRPELLSRPGRAAPAMTRSLLPKPVARRPSPIQVSYRSAMQSVVPCLPRAVALVRPLPGGTTFRRRLRRRCLLLFVAGCACFVAAFYTPLAAVPAALCALAAAAELRSAWSRPSPVAHAMAAAALALSAASVLARPIAWMLHRGFTWPPG